jgi:hypothetical protein
MTWEPRFIFRCPFWGIYLFIYDVEICASIFLPFTEWCCQYLDWSLDDSVGIAMGCRLNGWGSIPGTRKRFLFIPQRPDRLWVYSASYPVGTRGSFIRDKATGTSSWPLNLHLVPRLRIVELYLHSYICLHGIMPNYKLSEYVHYTALTGRVIDESATQTGDNSWCLGRDSNLVPPE